jgi:hypothetical protein
MEGRFRDTLGEWFKRFAVSSERDGSFLYAIISAGVAENPFVVGLLEKAPPRQRRPVLLFAIVHDLLLEGLTHPLATTFPTVAWQRGVPRTFVSDEELVSLFVDLCHQQQTRIEREMLTRFTQTNEVGRVSAIRPALVDIARRFDQNIALVDLGSSAGLALRLDHYRYRVDDDLFGNEDSQVTVELEVREGHPPRGVPTISWAKGIDQNPMNPADAHDARWLLACQWTDHLDRFQRLHYALKEAANDPSRPEVVKGDIVATVSAVAEQAPKDAHLVITHTWVATYLTPETRARLRTLIAQLSRTRSVTWLFEENSVEVPDLFIPTGEPYSRSATALVEIEGKDGELLSPQRIGDCHDHGRWIRWWGYSD